MLKRAKYDTYPTNYILNCFFRETLTGMGANHFSKEELLNTNNNKLK